MRQACDKELSLDHLKLFIDWCSEFREIRTMWINRLYFEDRYTNLRHHIFTEVSEEAMCTLTYLPDETTMKLTHVIVKCCVVPIRHITKMNSELQAAVCGVRLRNQVLSQHYVKDNKIYYWTNSSTVLHWLKAAHKKNKCFSQTEQRKNWKILGLINGDTSKASKTLPASELEEYLLRHFGRSCG